MMQHRNHHSDHTGADPMRDELRSALDHAQHLSDSRAEGPHSTSWAQAAIHVGDLPALAALTMHSQRRR
jgi:hypothetical protein